MNINSQFYIANYTGKEPLDLMSMPVSFVEAGQISDYNRFIEAISTIYASQNATGGIPVFWTVRNTASDAAGNNRYVYSPSDNSTLTSLEPRESYYFIVRDTSYIPLRVPVVGGSLPGFAEANELPIVIPPSSTTTLTQADGNKHSFSVKLDRLQPYETYQYTVSSAFSNWPVIVTPISGLLKPSEQTSSIDLSVTFCSSTGVCGSGTVGLLDYTLNNNGQCISSNVAPPVLGTTLQIEITPVSYSGLEILSKQFSIECEDCLPKVIVDLPNLPVTLSGKNNYCHDIVATLDNLVPYQTYQYEFRSTTANWPAVVTPVSGVFKSSKDTNTIRSRLAFCPSTILCSSGTMGLLDYDINSYQYLFDSTCGKFVTLELAVTPSGCSSTESISDRLTVYCLDCLGEITAPTLSINVKTE